MSQVFDQDAPETQLGFKEAQQNAELLHQEMMRQYDLENTPYFTEDDEEQYYASDTVGAEARHHEHLIQNRPLLGNVDQWKPSYEYIDRQQAKAEELHAEMLREIESPYGLGDIAGAEKRLHKHLDEHRSLLGNQEQWSRDYAIIDNDRRYAKDLQHLNLRKDDDRGMSL